MRKLINNEFSGNVTRKQIKQYWQVVKNYSGSFPAVITIDDNGAFGIEYHYQYVEWKPSGQIIHRALARDCLRISNVSLIDKTIENTAFTTESDKGRLSISKL